MIPQLSIISISVQQTFWREMMMHRFPLRFPLLHIDNNLLPPTEITIYGNEMTMCNRSNMKQLFIPFVSIKSDLLCRKTKSLTCDWIQDFSWANLGLQMNKDFRSLYLLMCQFGKKNLHRTIGIASNIILIHGFFHALCSVGIPFQF